MIFANFWYYTKKLANHCLKYDKNIQNLIVVCDVTTKAY